MLPQAADVVKGFFTIFFKFWLRGEKRDGQQEKHVPDRGIKLTERRFRNSPISLYQWQLASFCASSTTLPCYLARAFIRKTGCFLQPHVQITLLEGCTPEQKRKIVERFTATMVEAAGTTREAVSVAFVEVSTAGFAWGGA